MGIFSLESVQEVGKTEIKVYYLCIDGENISRKNILKLQEESTYAKEVPRLFSIIQQACNLNSLPDTKFKQLKNLNKVYEARSKNLRMYLVGYPKSSRTIILIGKKTEQKADIKRIKSLVQLLTDQIDISIISPK